jgi:hypothetical protein
MSAGPVMVTKVEEEEEEEENWSSFFVFAFNRILHSIGIQSYCRGTSNTWQEVEREREKFY